MQVVLRRVAATLKWLMGLLAAAGRLLATTSKWTVGILAVMLTIWSFYWVGTRPWRLAEQHKVYRFALRDSRALKAELVGETQDAYLVRRGDERSSLSKADVASMERLETIELTVMHWSGGGGPEEDKIVADLIADFERQNPEIKVRRTNPGDAASLYTKLQTMMAAGSPPDVFYLGSERVGSFARHELLAKVEDLIAADKAAGRPTLNLEDFYEPTLDTFRFDGQRSGAGPLYGVPKDFTTIGFYYNKEAFDKAGVPYPPDEWSWEEFVETARAIGKHPDYIGAEFVTWPAMVRAYLWTWGLDIASQDFTEFYATDPAVADKLALLRSWRFEEEDTLTSGKSKVAQGESVFLTGRVGMAGPFGRWVVPTYRKIKSFEWDFAPLPYGSAKANAVFTVAWAMAAESKHPDEAWKLMKHLSGPAGQTRVAELGLAIPTLKSVANSRAFIQPDKLPRRDTVYLEQVDYARAMEWPADNRYEQRMQQRMEQALQAGDIPLDDALARLEADWRRIVNTPLQREDFPQMPWGLIAAGTLIPLTGVVGFAGFFWWRRRPGKLAVREEIAGYTLVSPWVFGFVAFMAFPIAMSLLLAFAKWSGVTTIDTAQWVGVTNFEQLLGYDPKFWTSLRVTVYYALFAVPIGQLLSLGAALLMNHDVKLSGFFRSAWYLPSVLAGVGIAVLWRWVFDGDHGLMNAVLTPICEMINSSYNETSGWLGNALGTLSLQPPEWFAADANWYGPPAFAIMSFWAIGGTMVIYLAGLKGIPTELYEAASIDGATNWRRLLTVTLPMLSPVIFFNFIMAIIASFQVFTQAYVMTGGGPGDATRFYVLYLYNEAFESQQMGYASAMAWLLLILILGLTLLTMWGSKRFVYYEALR